MNIALIGCLLLSARCLAQPVNDLSNQVNPFVGTAISSVNDYGKTWPGAVRPFGMLYWSPDPVAGGFYRSKDTATPGFSLTHLSGPGCGIYGDIRILPLVGTIKSPPPREPNSYLLTYDPSSQIAHPGYYAVMSRSGIHVELAAAVRSGIAQITFPIGGAAHTIMVDLSRNLTHVNDAEINVHGRVITGSIASGGFCGGSRNYYRIFFALEVDQQPQFLGTFNELKIKEGDGSQSGPRSGGYVSFSPVTRTVQVKAAISYVSIANAEQNLKQEIPGWNFGRVHDDARSAWNEMLSHAQVNGGANAQRRVFYTALYHALLSPTTFSDVNGEYIGFDDAVHQAEHHIHYTNYSGWDIYRSQVQLIAMLFPHIARDMAQSLVIDADQGGGLPIWPAANDESGEMVGDPSDLILGGIYAFGVHGFDTSMALTEMLHGANDAETHVRLYQERPELAEYRSKGYISQNPTIPWPGAASVTLEYENADFAISQFAKALGDSAIAQEFLLRSAKWRKLFDPKVKYIRPRNESGQFMPDFTPASEKGFVEGNSAQYTWMIPYDLKGVIEGIGGPEAAKKRLNDYFSQYGTMKDEAHFNIGNEPSFGDPWIYNWTGQPWRTQEVVRKTLKDLFSDTSSGLPGNDDLGATSSWIVFAQLGIYPEIPGVGGLTLNSPTFPDVTLKLGTRTLQIIAPGASVENAYVKNITLDGALVSDWWITWRQLSAASRLKFELSAEPNKNVRELPPSFAPLGVQ